MLETLSTLERQFQEEVRLQTEMATWTRQLQAATRLVRARGEANCITHHVCSIMCMNVCLCCGVPLRTAGVWVCCMWVWVCCLSVGG